jgi:hypothetical protein
MELVVGLLGMIVIGLAVVIPVIAIRRLRDSSAAMLRAPDDLRRADDGSEPKASEAPVSVRCGRRTDQFQGLARPPNRCPGRRPYVEAKESGNADAGLARDDRRCAVHQMDETDLPDVRRGLHNAQPGATRNRLIFAVGDSGLLNR